VPDWLSEIVATTFVGVLTGIATVQLGLRRFYREKWWEKRLEAYSNAIAAVGELHLILSAEKVSRKHPETAGTSRLDDLPEQARKVMRVYYFGGLLMSGEMTALLKDLAPRLLEAGQDLDALLAVTNDVIAKGSKIARKDLDLPSFT
jgi:hypothetical protein